MLYLQLFIEFFKTGLFSVGGGLATIPFLNSIADRYDWFTRELLGNMIAIAESTPGPIGVNVATYAGFTAGAADGSISTGILCGIFATLSLVLPSVIIIIIVARIFEKFKKNKLTRNAFYGIRPITTGMIAASAIDMLRTSVFTNVDFSAFSFADIDFRLVVIFAVLIILTNKIKIHPIFYILLAGAAGALLKL